MNGITYVTGYTGLNSAALSLVATSSQYVSVSSPQFKFTNRSFTIEMWFYVTVLASFENGLFNQCQQTTTDECIICMIRNDKLYLAFHGGK